MNHSKSVERDGIVLDAVPGGESDTYDLLFTAPAHGWRRRYEGYVIGSCNSAYHKYINRSDHSTVGMFTDVFRRCHRAYDVIRGIGGNTEAVVVVVDGGRLAECKYTSPRILITYMENGLCATYTCTPHENDVTTVGAPIWRMVHDIRRVAPIGLCHGLTRRLLADL